MKIRCFLLCTLLLACASCTTNTQAAAPKQRWFYLTTNFLVDENVPKNAALLRRAKAAGYNGIALSDTKFSILKQMPPSYFRNARAFKTLARQLNLDIYTFVCKYGFEGGPEMEDPQLAEGLPVCEAPYVIAKGAAQPVSVPKLKNGDLEASQGNTFSQWGFQDAPGQKTFRDTSVKHSGAASMRIDATGSGNKRLIQTLTVAPWRQYHLSAWIKTRDFQTSGIAQCLALGDKDKVLTFKNWHIERSQDWTHYESAFNTLGNSKINVYFGAWGEGKGTMWWDDLRCEDAGFSNLLRRPGCPFKVQSETGISYQEGRDFQPFLDPKTGTSPWIGNYDEYHQPPVLKLAPGSRIREGQKLKISFYHAVISEFGSVASCPSEPKIYTLALDELKRVNELWEPKGFFLAYDEIRQMNWCEACQKRGLTPGQLLADNVRRNIRLARGVNSKAEIYIWSDMFDPNHNAVDNYYLVNGTLANSWEGLDKGVKIMNWNFDRRDQSLKFFAGRGQRQMMAGYYDGKPEQIRAWLASAQNVAGVDGVMYTTWENNYTDLEAFAKIAWG